MKQNREEVEWNGNESPQNNYLLKVTNPKTGKKYSVEFVVVPDDLTPLTGARIGQQMELITVYEDHFVSVPPPQKKQWRVTSKALQQMS